MRPYDAIAAVERKRTQLRTILFLIILGTLPFYLLAGILLAFPSNSSAEDATATVRPTNTPIGANLTPTSLRPTLTPFPTAQPLGPTPGQFIPPPVIRTNTPPIVIPPTATLAPTLTPYPSATPFPTNTPPPPNTPLPPPSDTPPVPILPTVTNPGPPGPPPGGEATQPISPP